MRRRPTGWVFAGVVVASLAGAGVVHAEGLAPRTVAASSDASVQRSDGASGKPGSNAGPPYQFQTELMNEFPNVSLKNQVALTKTSLGYRFWSGQQNSRLTVTLVNGRLRFHDKGTRSFKRLTSACRRVNVRVGVAASCRVPNYISAQRPLLLEIWPRLGDDYTNTSTLPASFAVSMLGDKGNDVARFGAGWDFFNGFSGRDRVWGSAGNDWIRAGIGNDVVYGGPGDDDLLGMDGSDRIRGGGGDDRLGGDAGADRLQADAGSDWVLCGTGADYAAADGLDRIFPDCESVARR